MPGSSGRPLALLAELPDVALISLDEAAQLSHVHEDTIRRAGDRGELPLIDVGEPGARRPTLRVQLEDLRAWWRARRRSANPSDRVVPLPSRRSGRTREPRGTLRVTANMGRDAS